MTESSNEDNKNKNRSKSRTTGSNNDSNQYSEKISFMRELQERAIKILSSLREPEDWIRVKLLLAEEVAKLLAEFNKCIKEIYLIELSGGEPVNEYEGGLDIDLFIKAEGCSSKIEEYWPLTEEIIKESLVLAKDYKFIRSLKRFFGKGLDHNLIEFHVNKEYLEPLIRSKHYYKQRLYP